MLLKAKRETEDAIHMGNKKYNDMLAERMRMEDQLNEQIQEVWVACRKKEARGGGREGGA